MQYSGCAYSWWSVLLCLFYSQKKIHCQSSLAYSLLLLISQLYSPWWALASFTISCYVFRSCALSFHLPILIRLTSSFTSWSHLLLGLPLLRTPQSSPSNKHFRVFSLSIHSTWPSQLSLRDFACLCMSSPWSKLLISELALTLQTPSSQTGP
jgi:hypothetical protein